MIFFGGRDAGIVGSYGLIDPPFLVVPGAVAIEQILSIVHVNHPVLFIGVVIAWKPNIYVSGGHESGGEIMKSVYATLTWCCVGRSNKRVLTKNFIGCSPTKKTEETGIKRVNRKSHRFM